MTLRLVLAFLLALLSTAGHAACDTGLAERMHAKLHPKQALDHERAVCQPWRGFAGRFIVVLPLPRPASEPGVTQFDLDVLVVQQADNGTAAGGQRYSDTAQRSGDFGFRPIGAARLRQWRGNPVCKRRS